MITEYNTNVQKLFLRMMLAQPDLYTRVMPIMNPENFDRATRPVAEMVVEHATKYSTLPTIDQINAVTGANIEPLDAEAVADQTEFFMVEFENFTKRQELERAILKSVALLEKGDFEPVEKLIKDAVQISLQRDLGTDYFADPADRLNRYFNQGGQISTGWPQLDQLMYGGFSRGELNIFAGPSGSGKSLVMMNLAINLMQQGLNGVYVSLELSEELTALRTDAMLTGMSTKEIRRAINDATLKVAVNGKKMGKYRIKALPAQSNVNAIRAYVKEVQIQTKMKIDFIMVDYLDLLMPVSVKVNPSDHFTKDKYVSEELRNLSKELGVIMVTASQLNRGAVEEVEYDHSHIAGGISKINSADYVFGIYVSRAMKERGKYQLQCMKSRSSTGVGSKIDLEYSIDTMRISDGGANENTVSNASAIMNAIKPKQPALQAPQTASPVAEQSPPWDDSPASEPAAEEKKVRPQVGSARLATLISSLKTGQ